jgi:hypothetical protein
MRRTEGFHYFLTLTAPGDRAHKLPSGDWCPCTPADGVDLARWNAGHSARWNHFRTVMRREESNEIEYFRGVEVQKRGALHDHAMVHSPVPLSEKALRDKAIRANFGHELHLVPVEPNSRKAAYYVSKYITKATDQREDVPWWGDVIDYETGEVTEGVVDGRYRTWSMSRAWGDTMAQVRAQASAYAESLRNKEDSELLAMLGETLGAVSIEATESPPLHS